MICLQGKLFLWKASHENSWSQNVVFCKSKGLGMRTIRKFHGPRVLSKFKLSNWSMEAKLLQNRMDHSSGVWSNDKFLKQKVKARSCDLWQLVQKQWLLYMLGVNLAGLKIQKEIACWYILNQPQPHIDGARIEKSTSMKGVVQVETKQGKL